MSTSLWVSRVQTCRLLDMYSDSLLVIIGFLLARLLICSHFAVPNVTLQNALHTFTKDEMQCRLVEWLSCTQAKHHADNATASQAYLLKGLIHHKDAANPTDIRSALC